MSIGCPLSSLPTFPPLWTDTSCLLQDKYISITSWRLTTVCAIWPVSTVVHSVTPLVGGNARAVWFTHKLIGWAVAAEIAQGPVKASLVYGTPCFSSFTLIHLSGAGKASNSVRTVTVGWASWKPRDLTLVHICNRPTKTHCNEVP